MGELLTKDQIKLLRKHVSNIEDINYNFEDIDYTEVREALLNSPLAAIAKSSSENLVIKKRDDGEYYEVGKEDVPLDSKYYPIISTAQIFSDDKNVIDMKFIKMIYKKIEVFFEQLLTFNNEIKKHKKRIIDVACNIDKYYTELRNDIIDLGKRYDNKIAELLLFLPDFVVYFFRYLASEKIPPKHKAKVIVVLIYIIAPIDVIPEALVGAIGLVDDLYLSLKLFRILLFDEQIERSTQEELWPGMPNTLDNIDVMFDEIVKLLGFEITRIIDMFLNKQTPSDLSEG